MTRLVLQVAALLAISVALAVGSNVLRSERIDIQADPSTYRYKDVEFMALDDAATIRDEPTTLFLDARAPADFAKSRIFGAVPFTADDIDTAYADLRDFLSPDLTLIVYSEDAVVSVRAARFLSERGYSVQILEGGWEAWDAARLPVE